MYVYVCLEWKLNRELMSNKPTCCLLDYDNYYTSSPLNLKRQANTFLLYLDNYKWQHCHSRAVAVDLQFVLSISYNNLCNIYRNMNLYVKKSITSNIFKYLHLKRLSRILKSGSILLFRSHSLSVIMTYKC